MIKTIRMEMPFPFLSRSPAPSSGGTPEEARKALDEAVHPFLVTAENVGTLEEILEEAGYQFKKGRWVSPSWLAIEKHSTAVGV
jgi:hypothetical protein